MLYDTCTDGIRIITENNITCYADKIILIITKKPPELTGGLQWD